MGVRRIDLEKCTACGHCYDVCPMDVFRIDEKTEKPFVRYLADCMSCFLCEMDCPANAIYVTPDRERRMPRPW